MGRLRAVPPSCPEDLAIRSKRKRPATKEYSESAIAGQGIDQWTGGLYHCNYCNKDVSGDIRIKCAICPDFDLCVECFSVGVELTPHKSNHLYRVMDNLSFPLLCPDWTADEEVLLLEGIEMYGLANWKEVAGYIGTKSNIQCVDHYNEIFMRSPCLPLPDMSHVVGKSKEELLAMYREKNVYVNQGCQTRGDLSWNDFDISAVTKEEDGPAHLPSAPNAAMKLGAKKPNVSGNDQPCSTHIGGYNPKRQEFDVEYDNDAEQLLADMEFKETETDEEHNLKLKVLQIYSRRLEERKHRKDLVLERKLIGPFLFEKKLSSEERQICQLYKVFLRFHTNNEHEKLLRSVISEWRICKRIQGLQDARVAGCCTSYEAERFIERKEAEDITLKAKDNCQPGPSGKVVQHTSAGILEAEESCGEDVVEATSLLGGWDINGFPGFDLLSENEKLLCEEMRLLPSHYLKMVHIMMTEMRSGNISTKSDAYNLFKVDPRKIDRVYDALIEMHVLQQ